MSGRSTLQGAGFGEAGLGLVELGTNMSGPSYLSAPKFGFGEAGLGLVELGTNMSGPSWLVGAPVFLCSLQFAIAKFKFECGHTIAAISSW